MNKNTHGPMTYHACVEETLGRSLKATVTLEPYRSGKSAAQCAIELGSAKQVVGRTFADYDEMVEEVAKWIELIKTEQTHTLAARIDSLKPITAGMAVDHLLSLASGGDIEGLDHDTCFYALRAVEDLP